MKTIVVQTAMTGTYAEAAELDLHRAVHELGTHKPFLVVRRDAGAEDFAQALWREDEGAYTVEYSTKAGTLHQTRVSAPDDVHRILAGWAFRRSGWRGSHTWTTNPNDDVVDFRTACSWSREGDQHVVHFDPLGLVGTGATEHAAMAQLLEALEDATQQREMALTFSAWAAEHVVKRSRVK